MSYFKSKINLLNILNSQAVISRWYVNSSFGFLWHLCRRNSDYGASYFSNRFLWPHCRWSWNVNTFISSNCIYLDLFAPIFYQCLWLAKERHQLGVDFWAKPERSTHALASRRNCLVFRISMEPDSKCFNENYIHILLISWKRVTITPVALFNERCYCGQIRGSARYLTERCYSGHF